MFRDRQKALEELERQLLEDEEEKIEEEVLEEEAEEGRPPRKPFDFDAYNTDDTDTDLNDYSEAVYHPRRRTGCGFWLLLLAALILFAAYCIAKKEGLL